MNGHLKGSSYKKQDASPNFLIWYKLSKIVNNNYIY